MSYLPASQTTPRFSNMPGGGKFVVVLLWVRFGLSICTSIGLVVATEAATQIPEAAELLPDWFRDFVVFKVLQTFIWVIFYAMIALNLPQRSKAARTGAIVLEVLSLAISGASHALLLGTYSDLAAQGVDFTGTYAVNSLGLVESTIVLIILSGRKMKHWCDR